MSIKLYNSSKFLKSVECENKKTYYVPPKTTVIVPSKPKKLPKFVNELVSANKTSNKSSNKQELLVEGE